MKKVVAILLMMVLLIGLCSCTGNSPESILDTYYTSIVQRDFDGFIDTMAYDVDYIAEKEYVIQGYENKTECMMAVTGWELKKEIESIEYEIIESKTTETELMITIKHLIYDELEELFPDYGAVVMIDSPSKIEDIRMLRVRVTKIISNNKETNETDIYAFKINGKWKLDTFGMMNLINEKMAVGWY